MRREDQRRGAASQRGGVVSIQATASTQAGERCGQRQAGGDRRASAGSPPPRAQASSVSTLRPQRREGPHAGHRDEGEQRQHGEVDRGGAAEQRRDEAPRSARRPAGRRAHCRARSSGRSSAHDHHREQRAGRHHAPPAARPRPRPARCSPRRHRAATARPACASVGGRVGPSTSAMSTTLSAVGPHRQQRQRQARQQLRPQHAPPQARRAGSPWPAPDCSCWRSCVACATGRSCAATFHSRKGTSLSTRPAISARPSGSCTVARSGGAVPAGQRRDQAQQQPAGHQQQREADGEGRVRHGQQRAERALDALPGRRAVQVRDDPQRQRERQRRGRRADPHAQRERRRAAPGRRTAAPRPAASAAPRSASSSEASKRQGEQPGRQPPAAAGAARRHCP